MTPGFVAHLRSFVGTPVAPARVAIDDVTVPAVRRWVEAMGDTNLIYLDHDAAVASGRPGIVAPPAMLGVWTMDGYRAALATAAHPTNAGRGVLAALADAGFTTTPATNCEQEYVRELRPGDRVSVETVVVDVSDEKQTALGRAHFVTNRSTFRDASGAVVGHQRLRVVAFAPGSARAVARGGQAPSPTAPAGQRLPALDIPLDRTAIATCAAACNDYRAGHYDPDVARAIGLRDIFTDIPTSTGFTTRFVTDWSGPASRLRSIAVRLGVPLFAGETLHLTGSVAAVHTDGAVDVAVIGRTRDGCHLTARATVELAPF
ncbi:MAG TPA: MaoC family dehydratase N-terminal domain-containing protein [Acidimicrobiales bacterium]|nr:MaoC family dehydratase N-terminal domain-containing protein [Acidimicrobiales bacterium]